MINVKEKALHWLASKRYNWKNYDFLLVFVVFLLSMISSYILTILEVTSVRRQIIVVAAGLFIIFIFSLIDYHTICMYVPILWIVATIMVACTKFSPLGSKGVTDSYRWLDFKIICVNMLIKNFMKTGGIKVKQHKFWAWAAIVCFVMLLYTGYTHK